MEKIDMNRIKVLWGNFQFEYACIDSIGASGGIISVWDPMCFSKSEVFVLDHMLIVKGTWVNFQLEVYMINVYAPQSDALKASLWLKIMDFMERFKGIYVIFGDFNSVRNESEKMGRSFSRSSALRFDSFIRDGGLVDIQMGGYKFTRSDSKGRCASKIDRFLVSPVFLEAIRNVEVIALDKTIADHRPVLLRQSLLDFGPKPFKFFNSWLRENELDVLVRNSWVDPVHHHSKCVVFKEKLKRLKEKIKVWRKQKVDPLAEIIKIKKEIVELDKSIDGGMALDDVVDQRTLLLKSLHDLEKPVLQDLSQKAKIKWGVDGDENSKFFHGIINKKRRQSTVNGLKINGEWVSSPQDIKYAFLEYFSKKFKKGNEVKVINRSSRFRWLPESSRDFLESRPSMGEVKMAIWDCGSDKAPGPDGFSFGFIKHFWEVMKEDIVNFVSEFFDSASLPLGCNSSFISLIPKNQSPVSIVEFRPISLVGIQYKIISKILANRMAGVIDQIISPEQSAFIKGRQIIDGPLALNEMIDWFGFKKKKMLVFKIDFAKAYDSVSWDYLDTMMQFVGFGNSWRRWIRACLASSRTSILVNGSPTSEFNVGKGLRQGDPLAPFLFILVMEGLHVLIEDACDNGMFSGIHLDSLKLSHFFYADDAIFLGKWSKSNIKNILLILDVFRLASGLSINIDKCSLFGVGVDEEQIKSFASMLGCKPGRFPFIYLGLPVGANMSRIGNWDAIMLKVKRRLSSWKRNLLSIGGRATLVSSVLGSLPSYYFSLFHVPSKVNHSLETIRSRFFWGFKENENHVPWIKWKLVLADKDRGGLGIGSLFAMNKALLYKWRWRFVSCGNALWAKIIKAIHGPNLTSKWKGKFVSTWSRITKSWDLCHNASFFPDNNIQRVVGRGDETKFWCDTWIGNQNLSSRFPRLFALAVDKSVRICDLRVNNAWHWTWRRPIRGGLETAQLDELLGLIGDMQFSTSDDTWKWLFENDVDFSVKSIRKMIDSKYLPCGDNPTRWIKLVPKKVNIMNWRLFLDKLPTRQNLSKRGMEIHDILCPICHNQLESVKHVFGDCEISATIVGLVKKWLGIDWAINRCPSRLFQEIDDSNLTRKKKEIIHSICFTMWWHIWNTRNDYVFNGGHNRNGSMLDSIIYFSYSWYSSRTNKDVIGWTNWVRNPILFM
ncbi:hypothetical protein SSX86_032453 [Deinandra increscens subsp. villosa]|uniref:Reverse transcriptase domain-containing protein n=1 Tax=Deinandra increscens subsp. villosa TaxID=3103831 RepID=A0AAP0GHA5_9ASTR